MTPAMRLVAFARRHWEALATGAVAAVATRQAVAAAVGGAIAPAVLWGVAALGAGLWCAAAVSRRLGPAGGEGPGILEIDERRIAYFGPLGGGVVGLDAIVRVSVAGGGTGGALWILEAADGTRLAVPAAAKGAERLPDTLSALPGFPALSAARALADPPVGRLTLWQRERPAALSQPRA